MDSRDIIRRIVATYAGLIRLYSFIRFRIIHPGILDRIERHLPDAGVIVDLGCGYGLFALYFALRKPGAEIVGLDLNRRRIGVARAAAERLGLRNVRFAQQDLCDTSVERPAAAAYAIDVLHHVSSETLDRLAAAARRSLAPGGTFVVKDVDTRPRWQILVCHLTDLVTAPGQRVRYGSSADVATRLAAAGFANVGVERIRDPLPYPHVLLVSSVPAR
jgi:SAM-dependent methyltransferase